MKNKVLFILLSFSLCFPLIAVSQNTHRENGWYHVIDNKKDSLSIEPILTVNDFATLELDTSNLGQYAIFGQISQQKIKKWAIETEKAVLKVWGEWNYYLCESCKAIYDYKGNKLNEEDTKQILSKL